MRVWFITGVSTGIGHALAEAVLATGDTVIGTLRKEAQCREFEARAPGRAIACQVDLGDATRIPPAFSAALARAGRIDVLVNNAGYGLLGALEESGEEEIRRQMETNFFAPLALIRCALPLMRAQRSGRIINISSVAGFRANAGLVIYGASKHALTGLSHGLAQELAPLGIHVTDVEPGGFRTEWAGPSMDRVADSIPDYAESAGKVRIALGSRHGQQSGDPVRAAQALITLAGLPDPPVFLVLGQDAASALRGQLKFRTEQLEKFESLSASTHFPDGG
jgi:NAD(P)-dependent dehydrogenase (short-subunit alcohol dehydrogenase family)